MSTAAASTRSIGSGLRARLASRAAAWARRRQGEDRPPLELTARRIYILPTRAGAGFALLLFMMLLAGLNYANSLALFLTFLFGGVGLVAMHQCQRNLLGIRITGQRIEPVFAGENTDLSIGIENPGALARFGLRIDVDGRTSVALALPPRARIHLRVALPCPKRGRFPLGRIRLSSGQPFGFFRAWTWLHLPAERVVYPRARGARPAPPGEGAREGERTSGAPGNDEWDGLRAFRDGDSPRRVAWKAYAREAGLLVKQYAASGGDVRRFDLAQVPGADLEARLEQLSRWIVDTERRGERYGLRLPTAAIPPDRGPAHRERCLAALADCPHGGPVT